MKILQVSSKDTYSLRQQLLDDISLSNNLMYPDDDKGQTFHLGAFEENHLISIASFFYDKSPLIKDEHQYRLRGMATLSEYRHKGYSRQLLEMSFPLVKQNFCTVLWCEARESSFDFYKKIGFEVVEGPIQSQEIGEHFVMMKKI